MCDLYREAPALAGRGERVVSTDEMTGVQALERLHPGLPVAPGRVERREFEYVRHGTVSLMAAMNVTTGTIHPKICECRCGAPGWRTTRLGAGDPT